MSCRFPSDFLEFMSLPLNYSAINSNIEHKFQGVVKLSLNWGCGVNRQLTIGLPGSAPCVVESALKQTVSVTVSLWRFIRIHLAGMKNIPAKKGSNALS